MRWRATGSSSASSPAFDDPEHEDGDRTWCPGLLAELVEDRLQALVLGRSAPRGNW